MNDNMTPGVRDALDYLKSGGLGEVMGLTSASMERGHRKVASDAEMVLALCLLALEAAAAAVKPSAPVGDLRVTGFRGNPLRVVLSSGEEAAIGQKLIDNFASPSPFGQPVPDAGDRLPIELEGVSEVLDDTKGRWLTCSGCHESNEGYPTGPYSRLLRCHLGGGCFECGGIGAVWDTSDFEEMARFMVADTAAIVSPAAAESGTEGLADE